MILAVLALFLALPVQASTQTLTLDSFLKRAASNDTEFEALLIDQFALKYRDDIQFADEFVLSVRQELGIKLDTDHGDDDLALSLSKLFRNTGTEVAGSYDLNPVGTSGRAASAAGLTITQPIAKNAFGRSNRMLTKIVGLEVEVARHQITEAYEDYFAAVIGFYLDWYEAHENLKIARSSYAENNKLLANMRNRKKARVADQIDVDKITLQVLGRKERLVRFEERSASRLNLVRRVLRDTTQTQWVPVRPENLFTAPADAQKAISNFKDTGRTYNVLHLLEKKSSLETRRELDAILPSISLFGGVERSGKSIGVKESENRAIAGLSLEFPFEIERPEAETAKIEERKTRLETGITDWQLSSQLNNLNLFINRERDLFDIATEKIGLAKSVLKEETKNYTYGKVSLNDYIESVNRLDEARFEEIGRFIEWRRLNLEWLRLTDVLVSADILSP